MKRILAVVAAGLVAVGGPAQACLNEYHERPPAKKKAEPAEDYFTQLLNSKATEKARAGAKAQWRAREAQLRRMTNGPALTFQMLSDHAVALLHIGETKEALRKLEELAAVKPKEYRIVANLGTAYELDGQLEKALANIKRAMELNPESHEGTEWLHVKILEAKIALAKDPAWLNTHTVIGQDFGNGAAPVMPEGLRGNTAEVQKISRAALYQLRERLQFVAPPDATVSDILYDMGNIYAVSGIKTTAANLYKGALKFGEHRKALIEQRLLNFRGPAGKLVGMK